MKALKFSLIILLLSTSLFVWGAVKNNILVSNKASYKLTDKAIRIKRNQFKGKIAENLFAVVHNGNMEIPSQLDDLNGDGKWDELFFVLDMPAKSSVKLNIHWKTEKPVYKPRTSVRFGKRTSAKTPVQPLTSDTFYARDLPKLIGYQPYQTDGPSWENDRVGWRHYYDGRNAKDLFGKKTLEISPENVGLTPEGAVEDNYHVLKDWGRDILPVANSVGLGGLGLMINGKLNRMGVTVDDTIPMIEKTDFKITAEGPVRSVIDFKYKNWRTEEGRTYQAHETPTIWPGMYAYQNSVNINGLKGDEELVVGLPKVQTDHPVAEMKLGDWVVLYTHDRQSYNKEFIIGLAIILPLRAYQGCGEAPKAGKFSSSYYGKLKIEEGKPLTYYAVGCWELAEPGFKTQEYFETYLKYLVNQLSAEVSVKML